MFRTELQDVQDLKIICLFLFFYYKKIMYTSESHFNSKASDCAIEEVYTNLDINNSFEHNPKIGYNFYYPYRFVNDPAQLKAVGIRQLDIEPTSHTMKFKIELKYKANNNREYDGVRNGEYKVLSENSLVEVLTGMCKYINESLLINVGKNRNWTLRYTYDNNIVRFYIKIIGGKWVKLRITGDDEFYKFLNQPLGISIPNIIDCTNEQIFENVWDRNYTEFHATFSDSNRCFIGLKGDFYTRPSLFYLVPPNATGFNVTFSDDNKNTIIPRYCKIIIQLCFVLNYKMFRI